MMDNGDEDEGSILLGDCVERMAEMEPNSIDAIVCDPPYGLEFMGKEWDKLVSRAGTKWVGDPESSIVEAGGDTPQLRSRVAQPGVRPLCRKCGRGASGKWGRCEYVEPEIYKPNFVAEQQEWHRQWAAEAYRVLKPGGHLVAFGGTRTYHRLVCGIEDAGFEIRDSLHWHFGSGFPKSMNVAKAIEKVASSNEAQQWNGWGTALKPAHEPIVLARKPLIGTVAKNVIEYGTGAINIDATRVGTTDSFGGGAKMSSSGFTLGKHGAYEQDGWVAGSAQGRWPANVLLSHHPECRQVGERTIQSSEGVTKRVTGMDESGNGGPALGAESWPSGTPMIGYGKETIPAYECVEGCPIAEMDAQSGERKAGGVVAGTEPSTVSAQGRFSPRKRVAATVNRDDTGGASGFFPQVEVDVPFKYQAKANKKERSIYAETVSEHPTVKPIALMEWLITLVTPPGGTVLDPFLGSGTTGLACHNLGFNFIGIEKHEPYYEYAKQRLENQIKGIDPQPKSNAAKPVAPVVIEFEPVPEDSLVEEEPVVIEAVTPKVVILRDFG